VVGKKERQKRLERERYQRRLDRQAQHQQTVRRWTVASLAAIVVLAVAVGVFFLVRPSGGSASASSAVIHCSYPSNPPAARSVGTPPATADSASVYKATIRTNRGNIVINLRNSKAPCTVNSFVYLAAKNYFSNTPCHRLTTSGIYVLQCGDPTGTGEGGPGYKFKDENLTGAKYTAGTVAMANSGANTNGSQFFLVYRNSLSLPASYTPFGTIVSGLNIIQNVAKAGSTNSNGPGDGAPKEKVEIESVTIKKT
jgi:peptidyl-prolyl cis-trans isomerase B (cyclophilin B)